MMKPRALTYPVKISNHGVGVARAEGTLFHAGSSAGGGSARHVGSEPPADERSSAIGG